jgi:hypothetical protein
MKTIKIKTDYGEWKEIEVSDESFKNIEKEVKPKFKIDDWVYFAHAYNQPSVRKVKVIEGDHVWMDNGFRLHYCYLRHATPEEIKEHLIKEAEERGFKIGVKIKFIGGKGTAILKYNEFVYHSEDDELFLAHWRIYAQGRWAEIIGSDTIKINGHEIAIYRNNIIVDSLLIEFDTVKKIYKQMKN